MQQNRDLSANVSDGMFLNKRDSYLRRCEGRREQGAKKEKHCFCFSPYSLISRVWPNGLGLGSTCKNREITYAGRVLIHGRGSGELNGWHAGESISEGNESNEKEGETFIGSKRDSDSPRSIHPDADTLSHISVRERQE